MLHSFKEREVGKGRPGPLENSIMGAPSLQMGNQPERAKWYTAGASLACSCHTKRPECLRFPVREAERKRERDQDGAGMDG